MSEEELFKQGFMQLTNMSAPQRNPCDNMNCGEAGCFVDLNQAKCICLETMSEPDENLRCNRTVDRPKDWLSRWPISPDRPPSSSSMISDSPDESAPHRNPCDDVNCGEAGCVVVVNMPKCICSETMSEPDENLRCNLPSNSMISDSPEEPVPDINSNTNSCENYNCGEAGCYMDPVYNKPMCMCEKTFTAPDENLRCNRTIVDPVDPGGKVQEPEQMGPFPEREREQMPNATTMNSINRDPDLRTLQIIIPVVGAIILVIVIIVALAVRRRRNVYTRAPKLDSPVAFLHKQDNMSLLENMTVVSKNPTYCAHDLDDTLLAELRDKHIRKDKLRLLEEIGEGAFGKVFKGEMELGEERSVPVAVKILKPDASRETRDDFRREVKIMSSFDHENILKLIGIVPTGEESPYMIFEYMEHGDLTEVLRRNDPCLGSKYHVRLRQTDLIDTATQISNGMVYLASRHFVHRDLATRNCLVGSDLVVKISDFGMSRDIYTCDYYKIGGARMLPVRWMSPESMKYGKFTTESDVWAFGVVLWEIFSFGKQPHYGHGNEEVIRFIEDGILLQKPNGCPETLYHVMLGCWRRDPRERFSFERIHNLLLEYERKVIKYARHLSLQRVTEPEEV